MMPPTWELARILILAKHHLSTLQQQEESWHATNHPISQFIAKMNDPLPATTDPLTLDVATFTLLMQYRIIDTAIFRDKKQPTRRAEPRPELKDLKLPIFDAKLNLAQLNDLPTFISNAYSALKIHISNATAAFQSATDLQLMSSYEAVPKALFTSICKSKRSKRVANLVMNFQTTAFHF
ncbi:hypothetical protein DXG01_014937 [Tephrocybe rancida]|nr:hypothetical protein DXG01_014937 [Tephrocybe rancida]